jgi:hypothetical protein
MAAPVRMSDGMSGSEPSVRPEDPQSLPQISERDLAKIERRRRKEERQRQVPFITNSIFCLSAAGCENAET